ncbi:hypothetical protein Y032_0051g2124 [Ancylostoma ceylanicum]|uniref:Uncharacterized protein n=1 Tax=Ancylostoma ceylanicum TaxID=53326 RepID=A0A016U9J6_9BILA|nr:hypothetical protein Y032_0051g2124 [Ancylostoma ceylanicum]
MFVLIGRFSFIWNVPSSVVVSAMNYSGGFIFGSEFFETAHCYHFRSSYTAGVWSSLLEYYGRITQSLSRHVLHGVM